MSLPVGTRVSFKAMQGDTEIEVFGIVVRSPKPIKSNWSSVRLEMGVFFGDIAYIKDENLTTHPVPVHTDECASLLYGENGEVPGDMPCDCGGRG